MKLRLSLARLGLKRRICIAIALISLIPVIILFYHFYGYYISHWAAVVLSFVVFLGWWIVFEVFTAIIKIHNHSQDALKGVGEEAPFLPNEVQSLETIISLLSNKVKDSFEQLRDFTKMTGELNKEVSKKVLILSTILQANDLFSKEAPAQEVIKFLNYHLKELLGTQVCFCNLRENMLAELKIIASAGIETKKLEEFIAQKDKAFLGLKQIVVLDSYHRPKNYLSWAKDLDAKNLAIAPVISRGQIIGMVGVGNNNDNFTFDKEDLDVLNLFSQNVTLIWEHERLSSKIEELEILDYLTGLYNEKVIVKRLDEEIKRATIYQRPCGFIRADIVNYPGYQKEFGLIEAEKILKKIARTFKAALKPIDIAGRIEDGALGAILIESNKRQSKEVADKLKSALEEFCQINKAKLSFLVAESPINGTTAAELMQFAKKP